MRAGFCTAGSAGHRRRTARTAQDPNIAAPCTGLAPTAVSPGTDTSPPFMAEHRALLSCWIAIALVPAVAHAQACRGRPGFTKTNIVANAGAMHATDVRSASAGLTVGSNTGPLASIAVGHVVREASESFSTDQTGSSLGASIAYAGTEFGGRMEFCPGAGISRIRVSGDFFGSEATLTQTSRRVGLSAGYILSASPDVLVVPFASAEYVWFEGSIKGDGINLPVPEDTYIPITIGAGAVLRQRYGATAGVVIPTGVPTAHRSFTLSLSVALGGR